MNYQFSDLSDIDDPRNDIGKRHPLPSILALLIIGLLCGLKGYTPIVKSARRQKELTRKLGWTHKLTPCAATFHDILKRVNVDEIEKALTNLNAYLDWPGVAQVTQFRYTSKNLKIGEETDSVYYGMTSLSYEKASAERLLAIKRGHWSIENKSHYVRDTRLGEDASPVRCGDIPQIMAAFRNTALSVLRLTGITRISDEMNFLV